MKRPIAIAGNGSGEANDERPSRASQSVNAQPTKRKEVEASAYRAYDYPRAAHLGHLWLGATEPASSVYSAARERERHQSGVSSGDSLPLLLRPLERRRAASLRTCPSRWGPSRQRL